MRRRAITPMMRAPGPLPQIPCRSQDCFDDFGAGLLTAKGVKACCDGQFPEGASWSDFEKCVSAAKKGVPDGIECMRFYFWRGYITYKGLQSAGVSGIGQDATDDRAHETKEAIEHALLGGALVAAASSIIGCAKGWKPWTIALGAALGAGAGYSYTRMVGA